MTAAVQPAHRTPDTVTVVPLPEMPNGTQRVLICGYGLRFVAKVAPGIAKLSRSQADDLADAWAAAIVRLTGGDPDA